jgi:hypothetical protein
MMKRFSPINNISGWVVFIAASFVYLSTIESTSSFWDCGEFIASAYKLEVGHPPGAPFFMLIGRFFTLFAKDDVTRVATMVNSLSALASALTIMFLFWTITHIARKIFVRENNYTPGITMAIIGSGLVGALAYAFSDTFWFSAVEGEVYATSSLFTAVVFWAILKWENIADEKYADRWIVLIAYLMGLSIGVHLLNLLAIPAIVLVYYFRKYKVTPFGLFAALFISAFILVFIQSGIIPHIVGLASSFELFFVNTLGMPYNSGIIVFMILLTGSVITGIVVTRNNISHFFNLAFTCLAVILLGYSSYAAIVIRSCANPPMNENNPSNVFSLLSYLNREQYGDRPLFIGQYFNAPATDTKDYAPVYTPVNGKYKLTNHKIKYVFNKNFITLFPRMWSSDPEHIDAYIQWAGINEGDIYEPRLDENGNVASDRDGHIVYDRRSPKKSPSFYQNLKFLFRYQLGHMYFRYFMWNFAGRQNDIQGHGYDRYGLREITKGNWISGIKFIDKIRLGNQDNLPESMTLNKARNRYFLLPLLLGLIGLKYHLRKNPENFLVVALLFILTGIAIVFYLNQYPYQPRERDYAYAGSFYAFAIWIGLGVLGIIDLLKKILPFNLSAIVSSLLCLLAVPFLMAKENWDDHDRSGRYFARDFAYNYLNSCAPNAILFTNGDNDTFPLWYAQDVEGIRTDVRVVNLSYLGADWYIEQMGRKAYESEPLPMTFTKDIYRQGSRDIVHIIERLKEYTDLKRIMDFVADDDPRTKHLPNVRERIDYIPSKKIIISVDSAKVIENGTVSPEMADKITPVRFEIDRRYITKNHLMVLDFLATNDWERPIYYAITVSSDNYLNLEDYFQVQGLAYRVVPIKSDHSMYIRGSIDSKIMYDNMINKFKWEGINDPHIYIDENVARMLSNFRNNFATLAETLIEENKLDSAKIVLDKCIEIMPDTTVRFDVFTISIIDSYYKLGETATASSLTDKLASHVCNDLDYYISLKGEFSEDLYYEKRLALHILNELGRISDTYGQKEKSTEIEEKLKNYAMSLTFIR